METVRGVEYGEVALAPREVPDEEVVAPVKPVIRKATPKDIHDFEKLKEKENEAREVFLTSRKA